jgi:hypothetical protein
MKPKTRLYYIKTPHVSSGLKTTYNKQLEVFSGYLEGKFCHADKIFLYKKGEWVEKPSNKSDKFFIMYSDLECLKQIGQYGGTILFFDSLDLAIAAKLLLIQKMESVYMKEIKKITETFKRNVPDVEKPLEEMKLKIPEFFI